MRTIAIILGGAVAGLMLSQAAQAQAAKALKKCAGDAVIAGTVCMDRYEASVWRIPDPLGVNSGLAKKVKAGKATTADLMAGGATQLGTTSDDYTPCTDNGQNCGNDIFAVSLPGEIPSAHITWFQAQAACANSGKRLPSNAEWQVGVLGTPDPGPDNGTSDCNTASTGVVAPTGSRSSCISTFGAYDMVGNLFEWVADWSDLASSCTDWTSQTGLPGGDYSCFGGSGGSAATRIPGALLRGGNFSDGSFAGPLAVRGVNQPSYSLSFIGFRCAR